MNVCHLVWLDLHCYCCCIEESEKPHPFGREEGHKGWVGREMKEALLICCSCSCHARQINDESNWLARMRQKKTMNKREERRKRGRGCNRRIKLTTQTIMPFFSMHTSTPPWVQPKNPEIPDGVGVAPPAAWVSPLLNQMWKLHKLWLTLLGLW